MISDSESVSEVIGSPNPEYLSTSQVAITTDTLQNSLATPATETDISSSPDDLTTSCSDYANTPLPVLQLDNLLDCASSPNTSTTESLNNSDMDTPVTIPKEPYSNKIMDILNNAGWDFNLENIVNTLSGPVSLCSVSRTSGITTATGKGQHHSWMLNYPALCFLVNGKYYSDYSGIFGMMKIPYMSQSQWDKVVTWLGENVRELALVSCKPVHQQIIDRGD